MGKAGREAAKAERERTRKKKLLRNIIIACVVVVAVVAVIVNTVRRSNQSSPLPSQSLSVARGEDGSLSVDRSALIDGFNYVNWGGAEELILYQTGDGEVMAAFDTCEECYPQGSVHFTARDRYMVCSVCGTTRALSGFGVQDWGECQPVSVPTAARLDTDSQIVVSGEAIEYAVQMFEQWDTGDMSMTFAGFAG